jgi:hypothetical protein
MKQAKHTPGPWRTKLAVDVIFIEPVSGEPVAEVEAPTDTDWANARLIAAAPELLEAAKDYVHRCPMCISGEECQDDLCFTFRAAIAKAEGDAQCREAHRLKQLQGAASLLLDALKNCQSALLLYDGQVTNPIDPQGWTESEGYSAYHDAEGAIQAAEGDEQEESSWQRPADELPEREFWEGDSPDY